MASSKHNLMVMHNFKKCLLKCDQQNNVPFMDVCIVYYIVVATCQFIL